MFTLDAATIITTEDCVDAVMSGLDAGELITVPFLQDDAVLRNFEASSIALFETMMSTGQPVPRYRLHQ
jgi:hypothetical protein